MEELAGQEEQKSASQGTEGAIEETPKSVVANDGDAMGSGVAPVGTMGCQYVIIKQDKLT